MRCLRRFTHSPKGDHDGHARGISVYFNSTQTVGPSRHTWRPRSSPGWAAGAGAAGHVVAPELPRSGQRELEPQDTWWPRSCPRLGSGSWSRMTRGGPRAAPGWAAGAGATEHVAALELPRTGQRELERQDTWRPRSCPGLGSGSWSGRTRGGPRAAPGWAAGARAAGHVAAPELPRAGQREPEPQDTWRRRSSPQQGVPDLQGTDSGPRAHLGRGCERVGGANFSAPRSVILIFLLGSR
jgi:hypothetical protein